MRGQPDQQPLGLALLAALSPGGCVPGELVLEGLVAGMEARSSFQGGGSASVHRDSCGTPECGVCEERPQHTSLEAEATARTEGSLRSTKT